MTLPPGAPGAAVVDLDAITAVVKPGTPKDAVRLIKRGSTQVSFGC